MVMIYLFFLSLRQIRYDSRTYVVGALSYLRKVRETFQDKIEKYEMFLDVMEEFKA